MIVPDVNLLLYAHDEAAPQHPAARRWWEALANGTERVGVPWIVAIGFVRLATHPSVLAHPLATARAVDYVETWFRQPNITPLSPGRQHLTLVRHALQAAGVGGNLATDAHIASLAIEYQAELHTNDADFSRFPGLRWRNPL